MYRKFVNVYQSKEIRSLKYEMAKKKYGSRLLARRLSTWTNNHFILFMKNNDIGDLKLEEIFREKD